MPDTPPAPALPDIELDEIPVAETALEPPESLRNLRLSAPGRPI